MCSRIRRRAGLTLICVKHSEMKLSTGIVPDGSKNGSYISISSLSLTDK